MEHEAIPNISASRRIGGKSGGGAKPGSSQKRKSITVDTIIREVSDTHNIITLLYHWTLCSCPMCSPFCKLTILILP